MDVIDTPIGIKRQRVVKEDKMNRAMRLLIGLGASLRRFAK
jgi:hypothetical protein